MNAPLLILLAEDNAGDVLLIRRALESHQVECKLIVAEDGDKVTAILARIGQDLPAPDVLILDLNLPRMDGRDMFQRVRAHPACSRTPLIVVTSSDSPADLAWTSAFGIAHYFRKPSNLDEFFQLGAVVKALTA
jgi:CheY-like chemotaxis protein